MQSFYSSLLFPETKQVLAHHSFDNYVKVLSRHIVNAISDTKETLSKLKQDLIYLLGFSNGEFGMATTYSTELFLEQNVAVVKSNVSSFGRNILDFSYKEDYSKDVLKFYHWTRGIVLRSDVVKKVTPEYIRVSNFHTRYFYHTKKNVIATSYSKKKSTHLFYFFKDHNAVFRKNNKTVHFGEDISMEQRDVFIEQLKSSGVRLNSNLVKSLSNHALIRYLSNPLWIDLDVPVMYGSISELPVNYSKLKYHYTKYGSKKLREVYFGTKFKSIQNSLVSPNLLSLYHNLIKPSESPFKNMDPNLQVSFLSSINTSYTSSTSRLAFSILELLKFGFSIQRLSSMCVDHSTMYLSDTGRCLQFEGVTLENSGVNLKDNIVSIHEKVNLKYRRVTEAAYYGREIPLTEKELEYDTTIDTFDFKAATITDELENLGSSLSICVRSYDRSAINKTCTIVGVYSEDGKPLACIEVRGQSTIVQAKLMKNRSVTSNKEIHQAVLKWAEDNKLTCTGYDFNENTVPL